METGKRLDDMLFIVNGLIELLTQENAALSSKNLDVVHQLLDRKNKLCHAYEIRAFGLKQDDAQYEGEDLEKVELLRELGLQVDELITTNEQLLSVELEVRRRFMDVVANAVKKSTPGTGAYGARGHADTQTYASRNNAPSMALDETL
ncbi:MAG: hypothetical protein OQK24_09910 [Magnetovibrio sp.]|nr:hypothetical protein [Magnetovibrio sp.]